MSVGWVALGATAVASIYGADKAENAAAANTAAATDSAAASTALGREQLDFTKLQYNEAKPYREAAAKTAQEVSEAQLGSLKQNDALAAEYAEYNRTTFRPLEQGIVADSAGYDTAERRQSAADTAVAGVNANVNAVREGRARQLAAAGINPGSARSIAALDGQDVQQASAATAAAYNARKGVETTGFARRMDAASLGRNLPSSQATSAGVAINSGNSAVTNALNGVSAVNAGVPGVQAGYSGAVQATNVAGGLYSSAASLAARGASDTAQLWGQLGGVAGTAIARYKPPTTAGLTGADFSGVSADSFTGVSDKNLKTDIEPMSDEEALKATNDTTISKWKYSPAKMAAAGIPMAHEDQGVQVGAMAQDIQQTMGDSASNGKRVNPVTMNGIAMKGVQAVDKKIEKLTKEVHSMAAMIRRGGGARATA